MTNKKQSPNHTLKKALSKKSDNNDWDEYLSTISHQLEPSNGAHKKRIAIELLEWIRSDKKACHINEFLEIKGIPVATYHRWMAACPELKAANEEARHLLGNRYRRNVLSKDFAENTGSLMLTLYDKEWESRIEWKAALQKKDDSGHGVIHVTIPSITSDIPVKKKEHEE